MSVKISGVERRSPAWRKGIRPGMSLLTVNGNEIQDVLDYRFYITEPQLKLEILCEDGNQKLFYLRKNQYDKKRRWSNMFSDFKNSIGV